MITVLTWWFSPCLSLVERQGCLIRFVESCDLWHMDVLLCNAIHDGADHFTSPAATAQNRLDCIYTVLEEQDI
jgi:hypothetical protein